MPSSAKNERTLHPRLARELKTVKAMISIYCRDKHGSGRSGLCDDCTELAVYAEKRLSRCPFQQDKPTCGTCLVHCYRSDKQKQIKEIMRYSGPRMLLHHPFLAIAHLIDDKLIKAPSAKAKPHLPPKVRDQRS